MTQNNNNTQVHAPENAEKAPQVPPEIVGEKEMVLLVEHLKYLKLLSVITIFDGLIVNIFDGQID